MNVPDFPNSTPPLGASVAPVLSFQCSPQTEKLVEALAKAQAEIDVASADSENPHFKSSYADLASVWAACRGPLSKNGVLVIQFPIPASSPNKVALITRVAHGDQWYQSGLEMPVVNPTAQGVGSALTYLRRYMLQTVAGVAPKEDDDGNEASGRQSAPPQREQKRPPNNAPVTEPQLKRLFAISNASKWTNEQVKIFLERRFQLNSTKDLTRDQYDVLCETIESMTFEKAMVSTVGATPPADQQGGDVP